jgi:UDP:flavonoid glycosyltransferase YjiC (YdhE family)
MRILWAVSSVGRGHVVRDIALADRLRNASGATVDWLAPEPAGDFLRERGHRVLDCSRELAGSGKVYEQVFADCTDEFNLMNYASADTKLHKHDFEASVSAWRNTSYDILVGDEAFWLLTGFNRKWARKPAPFVFITDFIGTRAMRPRFRDRLLSWYFNFGFSMSHSAPDAFVYLGQAEEIPDERLGFMLPSRREWARRHCTFVAPLVTFDPAHVPDKGTARKRLGLDEKRRLFLAVIGPEGRFQERMIRVESALALLREDFPDAHFVLVGPQTGARTWIQYATYLEGLHEYFAASDLVIIQSGYGKVVELSAIGTPFIAIPLDHHFEQEYVMGHRLKHYGTGELLTLRDHTPADIAATARRLLNRLGRRIRADSGEQVIRVILETARRGSTRDTMLDGGRAAP